MPNFDTLRRPSTPQRTFEAHPADDPSNIFRLHVRQLLTFDLLRVDSHAEEIQAEAEGNPVFFDGSPVAATPRWYRLAATLIIAQCKPSPDRMTYEELTQMSQVPELFEMLMEAAYWVQGGELDAGTPSRPLESGGE